MNRVTLLLSACVLALFLAPNTQGATPPEQSSMAAANCALDAPPDWHPVDLSKQTGMVAAFGDPDGNRTLMILTFQRGKSSEAINDAFAAGFDRGVEKAGGKKTAGKFTRVAGFEAYERRGTITTKGRDLTTLALVVPTGDGTYLIQALAARGEAGDDPEIVQAIASFRFLHPPGQPHRRPDTATRVGQMVGQSFGGVALLALIVLVIIRATSRRKPSSPAGFSGPYPYPQGGFPPAADLPPPLPAAPTVPAPPRPPDLY